MAQLDATNKSIESNRICNVQFGSFQPKKAFIIALPYGGSRNISYTQLWMMQPSVKTTFYWFKLVSFSEEAGFKSCQCYSQGMEIWWDEPSVWQLQTHRHTHTHTQFSPSGIRCTECCKWFQCASLLFDRLIDLVDSPPWHTNARTHWSKYILKHQYLMHIKQFYFATFFSLCSFTFFFLSFFHQFVFLMQFSLFFVEQNYKCAFEGVTICTHRTSLSHDLTSDQEKLFHGEKEKKPSGEQHRRIPLPGWTETIEGMCTEWTALQSYNTFNEYNRNVWIMRSRQGPRSRTPQSMKQKEE